MNLEEIVGISLGICIFIYWAGLIIVLIETSENGFEKAHWGALSYVAITTLALAVTFVSILIIKNCC